MAVYYICDSLNTTQCFNVASLFTKSPAPGNSSKEGCWDQKLPPGSPGRLQLFAGPVSMTNAPSVQVAGHLLSVPADGAQAGRGRNHSQCRLTWNGFYAIGLSCSLCGGDLAHQCTRD